MTFFVYSRGDSSVLQGDKNIQLVTIRSGQTIQVMQKGVVSVSFTKKHWVSILSTYQVLLNALFVGYLFKTIKAILVLYIDLQAKMLLSFKLEYLTTEHGFHQLISQNTHPSISTIHKQVQVFTNRYLFSMRH